MLASASNTWPVLNFCHLTVLLRKWQQPWEFSQFVAVKDAYLSWNGVTATSSVVLNDNFAFLISLFLCKSPQSLGRELGEESCVWSVSCILMHMSCTPDNRFCLRTAAPWKSICRSSAQNQRHKGFRGICYYKFSIVNFSFGWKGNLRPAAALA